MNRFSRRQINILDLLASIVLLAALHFAAWHARAQPTPSLPAATEARLEPLFVAQSRTLMARSTSLGAFSFIEAVSGRNIARNFDPATPLPTLVFLHGVGDHPIVPTWPYTLFRRPIRIVMLQGPIANSTGFQWIETRVRDRKPGRFAREVENAGNQVADFLTAFARSRPSLGKPILVGFSQGGHVAWEVALHHPATVSAVFPIAAWIPPMRTDVATPRAYNPPIRCFHGEADTIVPAEPSRALVAQLRTRGYDISLISFPGVEHNTSIAMGLQIRNGIEAGIAALYESWLNLSGAIPVDLSTPFRGR